MPAAIVAGAPSGLVLCGDCKDRPDHLFDFEGARRKNRSPDFFDLSTPYRGAGQKHRGVEQRAAGCRKCLGQGAVPHPSNCQPAAKTVPRSGLTLEMPILCPFWMGYFLDILASTYCIGAFSFFYVS
jgi:hypothetical protein